MRVLDASIKESLVKGKFLFSAAVMMLPMTLAAQVAKPTNTDAPAPLSKYEIFAGGDYSGANQVKGSSALVGFNVGGAVKLKKWFGATADFGDYLSTASSNTHASPTQVTILAGPEFYVPADSLTGFFHVLMGAAHTGGITGGKPDYSFAYAVGGGFEYAFSKKLTLRIQGDGIVSSFVIDPDNLGYSPHSHANARASAGVGYHF
jgi:opacity protein-like surface antigen